MNSGKIDGLILEGGVGGGDHPGPRHELADRLALDRRESRSQGLVGQQVENRLLLRDF